MLVMNNDNKIENYKIVEIVDCDSSAGCLKKSKFANNVIVQLPLILSFGKLDTMKDYDRSPLKLLNINCHETFFSFRKEIEQLRNIVEKAEKIRIWSSHTSIHDYLLLLYICFLFPDRPIYAVFADEYNQYCWSISCMDSKEVNELGIKERLLSESEKNGYRQEWERLVEENGDYRYLEKGKIKSVSISYFDDIILKYLKKHENIGIYQFIGELIGNSVLGNEGDLVYMYIINKLIIQKKIKVIGLNEKGHQIIKIA